MKPTTPELTIEARGGRFYPRTKLLIGGWMVCAYHSYVTAECAGKNLQYAFEQGWMAREEALRQQLDLND